MDVNEKFSPDNIIAKFQNLLQGNKVVNLGDKQRLCEMFGMGVRVFFGYPSQAEPINEQDKANFYATLTQAARSGQIELFQELIATEGTKENQFTLLMMAAFEGKTEIVQALIAAGADVKARINHSLVSCDALSLAIDKGHAEIVRLLAAAGADLEAMSPYHPLVAAINKGHTEVVRALIEARADINARGIGGSAVIIAAEKGHAQIVQLLADAGSDINTVNREQKTALMVACEQGNLNVVQTLIAADADVNGRGLCGSTALLMATNAPARMRSLIEHGFVEDDRDIDSKTPLIVQALLNAGANVHAQNVYGQTALMVAIQQGNLEVVHRLIAAGTDVNAISQPTSAYRHKEIAGSTALILAAQKGHVEIVAALLEAGADVNLTDKQGHTPLMLATRNGYSEIVSLLRAAGATTGTTEAEFSEAGLIGAAQKGDLELLQLCIQAGVEVNANDQAFAGGGLTALMYGAKQGHTEVVLALIDAGADLNTQDTRKLPWHKTALMYAAEQGHLQTVQALINAGADVNVTDRTRQRPGRTALIYAADEGHTEVVQALVNAGADVNARDKTGQTALMYAVSNLGIVRILLAAGADPHAKSRDGFSAFSYASAGHHKEAIQEMMQASTNDPVARAADYENALQSAAMDGDIKMVQTFIEAGVDVNARDRNGWTALRFAKVRGAAEIAQLLRDAGASQSEESR